MSEEETIRYRDAFPKDYDLPAFPDPNRTDLKGMTLRDYLAAKAMQAFISGWVGRGNYPETDILITLLVFQILIF